MALFGAVGSAIGASKAAKKQKKLTKRYKQELTLWQSKFNELSNDYRGQFEALSEGFDLYDLDNEFNSLYEAVIMPMERQFSESVLPGIRQGYSGGGYGSQMFSGARESTEAKARSDLSMNTALLKYQNREAGLGRNLAEYDRRRQDLGLQFDIAKGPVALGMDVAGRKYGASTDEIAATTAKYGAIGGAIDAGINTVAGIAMGGMGMGTAAGMTNASGASVGTFGRAMYGAGVGGTNIMQPNSEPTFSFDLSKLFGGR